MKGFFYAVAAVLAVTVFAFAFASLSASRAAGAVELEALESQLVHQRALDSLAMEDAAFYDALIDSGYSRMSCAVAAADFCLNFTDSFYNYSIDAEEVLNDSFFSVSLSPAAFCRLAATGMDGYQETYYANYSLAALVNSTSVFEPRNAANESLLDLNHSGEGVFKLRLRDASGNELHYVEFACP